MNELFEIVMALIEEIPCFAAIVIIHMACKNGFKHISITNDTFKVKLDK